MTGIHNWQAWGLEIKREVRKILRLVLGKLIIAALELLALKNRRVLVGRLYSSRIGHLCFNTENWISYCEKTGLKATTVFILDDYISNIKILEILRKNTSIRMLSKRWSFIHSILTNVKGGEKFTVDWEAQHPELSSLANDRQRFFVPNDVQDHFERLKFGSGYRGEHVCFHNRDSLYLQQFNLNDGNFHDYRDFSFETYKVACGYLKSKGITSIKIGKSDDIKSYSFEYWDLSGKNHQDSIDVAAIGLARFFVTGNTGITQIARLFRRPILAVNYAPCRISEFTALSRGSIVIPKLIFLGKQNRYMNLVELIRTAQSFDIHYKGNYFEDNDMLLINNTEQDILDGVTELENNLTSDGNDYDSDTRRKLSDLEELIPSLASIRRVLNIDFCAKFLDRHRFLLDF